MPNHRDPHGHGVFRAVAEFFASSTAVFWIGHGRSRASGIFIQHRGRFFVGTAAHTICDMKKGEPLHLVATGHVAGAPVNVKRLAGSHDPCTAARDLSSDRFDLGFIEFDEVVARRFTGARWLTVGQSSSLWMDVGHPAIVIGAPAEFDTVANGSPSVTAANLVAYGTSIITERMRRSVSRPVSCQIQFATLSCDSHPVRA